MQTSSSLVFTSSPLCFCKASALVYTPVRLVSQMFCPHYVRRSGRRRSSQATTGSLQLRLQPIDCCRYCCCYGGGCRIQLRKQHGGETSSAGTETRRLPHQGRLRSADRRRSPGGSDGLGIFLLFGGSRRSGEDGDPR